MVWARPATVENYMTKWMLLCLLFAGSIWAIARPSSAPGPFRSLEQGDTISALHGLGPDFKPQDVALSNNDNAWTIVLAFHSQCVWCVKVAPHWREWIVSHPDLNIVAVTLDDPLVSARFLKTHELPIPFLSVASTARAGVEQDVVRVTPWVFVFDAGGVLREERNAHDLNALELP